MFSAATVFVKQPLKRQSSSATEHQGLSGQAMLVTPFMLVMLRFLVDRYGPPVSVTVPWPILQPSSKPAAMTKSS
jgi:hypothetical protein